MAQLPFIVEPKAKPVQFKIGNDDVGVFEIERRGICLLLRKALLIILLNRLVLSEIS